MKLIFNELTIRNFLSFGNNTQTFKFDQQGIKLIKGLNKDKTTVDDEREQNGVGKTTIMQALYYALYGTSIGNTVTLSNLVNNINKKNMEVSLTFSLDSTDYKIERGRNPQYFRFYKCGEEITDESCGDSRDTQTVLQSIIGISPELFTQTVLLTCKVPIYLNQNLATRRQIIEQTLGFDVFAEKVEVLKSRIKQTKLDIEKVSFEIETKKTANETLRNTLTKQLDYVKSLSDQWVKDREMKITTLKNLVNGLTAIDFEKEKSRWDTFTLNELIRQENARIEAIIQTLATKQTALKVKIADLTRQKDALSAIDIEKAKDDYAFNNAIAEAEKGVLQARVENAKVKAKEEAHKNEIVKLQTEEARLNDMIKHLQENHCPYCGSVMPKAEEHLKQAEADLLKVKTAIIQAKANLEMCNDLYVKEPKIEARRPVPFATEAELYAKIAEIDKIAEQLISVQQETETTEKDIGMNTALIKPMLDAEQPKTQSKEWCVMAEARLKEIENELIAVEADTKNPYEDKIVEVGLELQGIEEVDTSELTELETLKAHQDMLLMLLSKPTSAVRQLILDKSIKFLNMKVVEYLEKLNSPIFVKFNSDMSVDMSRNGLAIGSPSSGEEGRISLALQFAFRDTWECLNGIHPSIMMVDEVIDRSGLDESGVSAAVSCIMGLNDRCRYVVSHNAKVADRFTDVVLITKHHDFTTIESGC